MKCDQPAISCHFSLPTWLLPFLPFSSLYSISISFFFPLSSLLPPTRQHTVVSSTHTPSVSTHEDGGCGKAHADSSAGVEKLGAPGKKSFYVWFFFSGFSFLVFFFLSLFFFPYALPTSHPCSAAIYL